MLSQLWLTTFKLYLTVDIENPNMPQLNSFKPFGEHAVQPLSKFDTEAFLIATKKNWNECREYILIKKYKQKQMFALLADLLLESKLSNSCDSCK